MSQGKRAFTPEVAAIVVAAIRAGRQVTIAADLARVHRDTLHGWLQRGEGGLEPYASFYADVRAARAQALGEKVDNINAAGLGEQDVCELCKRPKAWQALAWTAERLYPELQMTQKHEHVVQQVVERVLTAVRARMSESAYGELVAAIAGIEGVDQEPAISDESATEQSRPALPAVR